MDFIQCYLLYGDLIERNLNRNGIGIEMNEDYFNIASERVGKKIKEKDIEAPTLFSELN